MGWQAAGKQSRMSSPAAMTMPGGRVVLGWWADLAALAPRRLWFGHLILHVVETLLEVTSVRPLEPLALALLPWLARRGSAVTLSQLATELTLDPTLAHVVLTDLAARGRVSEGPGGWSVIQAAPTITASQAGKLKVISSCRTYETKTTHALSMTNGTPRSCG